jgi:hypothetical protein
MNIEKFLKNKSNDFPKMSESFDEKIKNNVL